MGGSTRKFYEFVALFICPRYAGAWLAGGQFSQEKVGVWVEHDSALALGKAVLRCLRDRGNVSGMVIAQADGRNILVYGDGSISCGEIVVSLLDNVIVDHGELKLPPN